MASSEDVFMPFFISRSWGAASYHPKTICECGTEYHKQNE